MLFNIIAALNAHILVGVVFYLCWSVNHPPDRPRWVILDIFLWPIAWGIWWESYLRYRLKKR